MLLKQDRNEALAETMKKAAQAKRKYEEARLKFQAAASEYEKTMADCRADEACAQAIFAKKMADINLQFDKEHGFSREDS